MVISRVRIVVWIVVVFVVIAVMVGYSVRLMMMVRLMEGSIMVISPVVEPPFFKLHLLCV